MALMRHSLFKLSLNLNSVLTAVANETRLTRVVAGEMLKYPRSSSMNFLASLKFILPMLADRSRRMIKSVFFAPGEEKMRHCSLGHLH